VYDLLVQNTFYTLIFFLLKKNWVPDLLITSKFIGLVGSS